MTGGRRYADYDPFAWFYNRYWGARFAGLVLPVLERLVFPLWPAGGRLLDLCCGTGQLAHALATRGFLVTGIDGSEAMLRHARDNAPGGEFILADAQSFALPSVYHGALSTFDSLNHVMSLPELTAVFRNVHAVLVERGVLLFDLNMEEGYRVRWRGTASIVDDDNVCIVLPGYDPEERIGRYDITLFELKAGTWHRSDLALFQRCYPEAEVRSALGEAGFRRVSTYDAEKDLGLSRNVGRTFFLARKA